MDWDPSPVVSPLFLANVIRCEASGMSWVWTFKLDSTRWNVHANSRARTTAPYDERRTRRDVGRLDSQSAQARDRTRPRWVACWLSPFLSAWECGEGARLLVMCSAMVPESHYPKATH